MPRQVQIIINKDDATSRQYRPEQLVAKVFDFLIADHDCHMPVNMGGETHSTLSFRTDQVRAKSENGSFESLCSTQFSDFGAQLWTCARSESSAARIRRKASNSPN